MTHRAYTGVGTKKTAQNEPIPGRDMVKNSAGGFTFELDNWGRLERFLILGSAGGTYYASQRKLTVENRDFILHLLDENGRRVVDQVVEISQSGRAAKNDPALFVMAMAVASQARNYAFAKLPLVARTATHLFHFLEFAKQFRGWGRGMRNGVADWYLNKTPRSLAYQVAKYRNRDGWTHADVLRLAHPKPENDEVDSIFHWITQGWTEDGPNPVGTIIEGFEEAKQVKTSKELVSLIDEYNLTWEMIPTQFHNDPDVWWALLQTMLLGAMVRNLGRMTSMGLVSPMSDAANLVCQRLTDQECIRKSRLHPYNVLVALKTYARGMAIRGRATWDPVSQVVDSLDDTFYLSFGNVETTGKRIMLALDVSGSMGSDLIGGVISCREASAAMAMATARVEPNYVTTVFSNGGNNYSSSGISTYNISPRQRLDDIVSRMRGLPFGGTDCALPMLYATQKKMDIDTFIIYTDNETWAGDIHPVQALQEYRNKFNPQAKLIVVGMTSTGFTIADPDDGGMLDVVGFDSAAPQLISNFVAQ